MTDAPKPKWTKTAKKTKCDECLEDLGAGRRTSAARMAVMRRTGVDGVEKFLCYDHTNVWRERDDLAAVPVVAPTTAR